MQKGSLLQTMIDGDWSHNDFFREGPEPDEIVTHDGNDTHGFIYLAEYTRTCECGCGQRIAFHTSCFKLIQQPMMVNINDILNPPTT